MLRKEPREETGKPVEERERKNVFSRRSAARFEICH